MGKGILTIECLGVSNISANICGVLSIDLQQVDVSFLEDVKESDIVLYANNEKLLNEMDADDVFTWVENKFGVTIKGNR